MSRDDRGSFTVWALGLALTLLFIGGIGIDAARLLAYRRDLSNATDAAARAGATGIDEDALRERGVLVLDPVIAEQRARAAFAASAPQGVEIVRLVIRDRVVFVSVSGNTDLPLVGLIAPDARRRSMVADAQATPLTG